jgi:hypothetical protein
MKAAVPHLKRTPLPRPLTFARTLALVALAPPADSHLSAGTIVIAALAALLALGSLAWGLARRRALEPRWWLGLRHAIAEAGLRASETWAEFTDWVRLGH